MIAVLIPVKGEPHVVKIDNGNVLGDLQACVGGHIEPCAPAELNQHDIDLLANEDGILMGLEPNENLFPYFFVGNLVAVGIGEEDFESLGPERYGILMDWLEGLKKCWKLLR